MKKKKKESSLLTWAALFLMPRKALVHRSYPMNECLTYFKSEQVGEKEC